eukprot:CAMPEP_0201518998 /NCGR_PEP_ID=MMETSP0161_2-20130828/9678_1 /ASSEMBLY_ACC=CAM_ASM_000251 /TAXON_ID=180227 /ORGANISM="Neoparamoeba aestuarina, Strain SoJaBio B1-5/56/2" /LENGTH=181 /DNA_ID=CAMNT_0047916919 /DNA_START=52 /DNA_END=597 /DNA_ORIENTATION=-
MANNGEALPFVLIEDEAVTYKEQNIRFFSDGKEVEGGGDLYVTTRNLHFVPNQGDREAWPFKKIIVHAVSRDPSSFPFPCLYCQIDVGGDQMEELHLVPKEEEKIGELFRQFSHAASLNPDDEEDEGGNDDFYFDPDEVFQGVIDAQNPQFANGDDEHMYADAEELPNQRDQKRRKMNEGD